MDKLEKVIKGLEHCTSYGSTCDKCDYLEHNRNEDDPHCGDVLMRDALELLKEKQPRVLELTEFKESMPVWFEEKDGDIYCVLIANYYGFDVRVLHNNKKYRSYFIDWLCDYYCIDWRCWSAKPTEEQRKAVPWKDGEQ